MIASRAWAHMRNRNEFGELNKKKSDSMPGPPKTAGEALRQAPGRPIRAQALKVPGGPMRARAQALKGPGGPMRARAQALQGQGGP